MTALLPWKRGVLGALIGALATAGGCADSSSQSMLLGEPKILQVLVLDPSESDDPDGSGLMITYGVHPDINACHAIGVDNSCVAPDMNGNLQPVPDRHCDLDPASPTFNHCVRNSDNQQPIVTHATLVGTRIRVVVGELLDGTTLEEFACACQGTTFANAAEFNCEGPAWSIDPNNCSVCGDNPFTAADESHQCLDVDGNGPDISALLPGVATITCGDLLKGQAGTTKLGNGFYYPSGNQFPWPGNTGVGYAGLGPAIVVQPSFPLPADSDCTLALSPSIRDQHGQPLEAPDGPIRFHSDVLKTATLAPSAGLTDVPPCLAEIDIGFNSTIAGTTAKDTNVLLSPAVAGAKVSLVNRTDTIGIVLPQPTMCATPATPALQPDTVYTVTVTTGVTDTYLQPLAETTSYMFTTCKTADCS